MTPEEALMTILRLIDGLGEVNDARLDVRTAVVSPAAARGLVRVFEVRPEEIAGIPRPGWDPNHARRSCSVTHLENARVSW
jgi:hypothetical protein